MGAASFSFELSTSAKSIAGKPFIIHNNAGGRVACGILSQVFTLSADLMPFDGSSVMGGVTVYTSSSMIIAAGWASGLEASLTDASQGGSDCTKTNGCGTHIHSGNSCKQYSQGGHFKTSTGHDPWENISYSSTNPEGDATFVFSLRSDRTDVLGKPFILHNNGGNRVSCGVLSYMPMVTFAANLSQIGSSGVSGQVTVFLTGSGLIGVGTAEGLEPNLTASPHGANCTATNGCGAHVHDGSACNDTVMQGGHYYDGTDPWGVIQYSSTDSMGAASFSFELSTSAKSIAGKPFIIHNNAGGRVACGILSPAVAHSAELMSLGMSGVTGGVTVYTSSSVIAGAGWASGLDPGLRDDSQGGSDCVATNGCGTHVHSGTSCDTDLQGGHLATSAGQDPWTSIRYTSTNANGHASFVFSVQSDRTDVLGKPFIVHNNSGARVSCGLLHDVTTTTTTPFSPSHEVYEVYVANLSQLSGSGVTGEVVVFVTSTGLIGIGSGKGLEPNLVASPKGANCTAANACGTHIHSGTACTDVSTQGTHDYDNAGSDPWRVIKFPSTDSSGSTVFTFELKTSATIIDGKPMMLHDNSGGRVACGILSRVETRSVELMPLSSSGVTGGATVYTSPSKIVAAGWANKLETGLLDASKGGSDCVAKNGCGTHVHSGTSCDQASQGGHLETSTGTDPWTNISYSSTNAEGYATFVFSIESDRTDVVGKPFIVHDNAGSRVSCGVITSDATTTAPTTPAPTPGPEETGTTPAATTPQATDITAGSGAGAVSMASPISTRGLPTLLLVAFFCKS